MFNTIHQSSHYDYSVTNNFKLETKGLEAAINNIGHDIQISLQEYDYLKAVERFYREHGDDNISKSVENFAKSNKNNKFVQENLLEARFIYLSDLQKFYNNVTKFLNGYLDIDDSNNVVTIPISEYDRLRALKKRFKKNEFVTAALDSFDSFQKVIVDALNTYVFNPYHYEVDPEIWVREMEREGFKVITLQDFKWTSHPVN